MSSRIDMQKRCKWCNAVFTAHKTTTEYCSHRCANLAYKDRVRKQRIESLQHELGKSIRTPPNLNKEYLTPSEVAKLLNIGRTSIYRYIHNGIIKVIRFERKTLVRRADIENMTDYLSKENEKTSTKEKAPIYRAFSFATSVKAAHFYGRSAGIRTRGLLVPNQARYQTSPHPVELSLIHYSNSCPTCQENKKITVKDFVYISLK